MTIARSLRRVLKGFAVLAVLGVLGIVALFGFLWLENRSEVTLPTPTGSFAVGRAIHDWTDSVVLDTLAPVPGTKRELLVWIWYPSAAGQSVVMDDYLPAGLRPKASHGYVVVGFDAPYRTGRIVFPDGRIMGRTEQNNPETCVVADRAQIERCVSRVLTAWTGDIAFVLDRLARLNASDSSGTFTGRLDMTRVGVFGHSLGGAVALQFCHEDSRCKAGIDIDGAPHGSVRIVGRRPGSVRPCGRGKCSCADRLSAPAFPRPRPVARNMAGHNGAAGVCCRAGCGYSVCPSVAERLVPYPVLPNDRCS